MAKGKSRQKKVHYSISAVAERFDIHPQTLRLYEREGLIEPSRTAGNTRTYSEEDLEQIALILTLTREMGVNLAGVEVVLHMKEKMELMQDEIAKLLKYIHAEIEKRFEGLDSRFDKALIRVPPGKIIQRSGRRRK